MRGSLAAGHALSAELPQPARRAFLVAADAAASRGPRGYAVCGAICLLTAVLATPLLSARRLALSHGPPRAGVPL